ncbi:MAG: multidrug efflux RND transporter permease subunit [Pseudomonadaceae bacterium]|nr:multidrug efflux RND transporter permease subunit [Pseudomonadaceae bacterium]
MSFSTPFILRPVATLLLTVALLLAGGLSFTLLPVAPLPQVDFPYIVVNAALPGASPETMASSVATPLERALGRIAGIVEMTSSSTLGNTQVVLQFDLERNIDGAAREVQAAINAAMTLLPTGMPRNPSYRKANPADMPIMILALTSETLSRGQLYDLASTVLAQKIAQAEGVGQVSVGGSSLPAVRVDLNPDVLNQHGLALDEVRQAISDANTEGPKGSVSQGAQHWQIDANDQLRSAAEYLPLIIRQSSQEAGQVLRLGDVAKVTDAVENVRSAGFSGGLPAVLLIITRQPAANIIAATDAIHALLPALRETIGPAVKLKVMDDRSPNIRASLHEAEFTLMVSVALVILVVFAFLRNVRATLIPSVAVPVSLIGTFIVMYLCDFSLNNLSLMALIIATGFVVDDAIVMLENIARRIEEGETPLAASLKGAREVGFTVLSMSLSLVAVFIPLLLMGGIPGRLFREFAVTLSAAVLISLLVSLTLTPMLCAKLLKAQPAASQVPRAGRFEQLFTRFLQHYRTSLVWALEHSRLMLVILLSTIALNFYLFAIVPKALFPQQDSGRMRGKAIADQSISFQALQEKLSQFRQILAADPAVENVAGFSGGGGRASSGGANSGTFFITLKPLAQREPMPEVAARLRKELAKVAGASFYLDPGQDLRIGGREGNAQYQFSLKSDDLEQLRLATPRVEAAMRALPELVDVSGDEQNQGLQTRLVIDRSAAARYGVDIEMISALLNNSFGQRQISTIYNPLNQYRVVMEVDQAYQNSPDILQQVYVISAAGARIPLSTFTHIEPSNTPLAVNHLGQFAATTLSFNTAPKVALETAQTAIINALQPLHLPVAVQTSFAGTAGTAQDTQSDMPIMILTALLAVYIVLGMLYESYVHPLTIISTLPSAGVGALLALLLCRTELSLIALIGIILLIGIVKKNAILMIDFALDAERRLGMSPREAILEACVKRFRPIMMTSLAALLGALPLLFGSDGDAELRRPLGITIVGGLIGSQLLTLYTTPVVYLYLDRLRHWALRRWHGRATPLPLENQL